MLAFGTVNITLIIAPPARETECLAYELSGDIQDPNLRVLEAEHMGKAYHFKENTGGFVALANFCGITAMHGRLQTTNQVTKCKVMKAAASLQCCF